MSHTRSRRYTWSCLALSLALLGYVSLGRAQTENKEPVHFAWAFEALVTEGSVTKPVPIREDMTLKTGDLLKFYLELRQPCFVYVIYHSAEGALQWLFPAEHAASGPNTGMVHEVPPRDAWLRINEQAGQETFYLLASAQRLTELEQGLTAYAAAKPEAQPGLAKTLLADLHTLLKQQRGAVQPGRPVPIAGNRRISTEALEIRAASFYSKTVTIEHR